MSDDIVWTPRTIRRVVEVVAATSVKVKQNIEQQWTRLTSALMGVLKGFPDAKDAVMKKYLELEGLETAPDWAT